MRLKDRLLLGLARLEPSGLSPVAPGTAGSAFAVLLAPWLFLPLPMTGRLLALAVIFVVGAVTATHAERLLGRKDPGSVVIDELGGQWLTLLPFADLGWTGLLAGFLFFRLFDILKPWPVKASESWLPSGWGIMIDDYVAGVYALAAMVLTVRFLPLIAG